MRLLLTLLAITPVLIFGQNKTVEIRHNGYTISSVSLTGLSTDNSPVVIAGAVLDSVTAKKEPVRFGMIIRDNAKHYSKIIAAEITDGQTGKSIRKISLEELFGKGNSQWKVSNTTGTATMYEFTATGNTFTLIRTVEPHADRSIPSGKALSITYSIRSSIKSSLRLSLFSRSEGSASVDGNIIRFAALEKIPFTPQLFCSPGPNTKITIDRQEKKNGLSVVAITGTIVETDVNSPQELLKLTLIGTSVGFSSGIEKQAAHIIRYFSGKKAVPEMAVNTLPNRTGIHPGDTVTYTITCHNIGSAPAADISIDNPVPGNTRYAEGSASGIGQLSYSREKVSLPKIGTVNNIRWKISDPVYPGEERSMKFNVIIQ